MIKGRVGHSAEPADQASFFLRRSGIDHVEIFSLFHRLNRLLLVKELIPFRAFRVDDGPCVDLLGLVILDVLAALAGRFPRNLLAFTLGQGVADDHAVIVLDLPFRFMLQAVRLPGGIHLQEMGLDLLVDCLALLLRLGEYRDEIAKDGVFKIEFLGMPIQLRVEHLPRCREILEIVFRGGEDFGKERHVRLVVDLLIERAGRFLHVVVVGLGCLLGVHDRISRPLPFPINQHILNLLPVLNKALLPQHLLQRDPRRNCLSLRWGHVEAILHKTGLDFAGQSGV